MNIIDQLEKEYLKEEIPAFRAGDTLTVHAKIREGSKERVQVFEGVCIARSNNGTGSTFTVRKVASDGVGVERVFPLHSPRLEKIEVKRLGVAGRNSTTCASCVVAKLESLSASRKRKSRASSPLLRTVDGPRRRGPSALLRAVHARVV